MPRVFSFAPGPFGARKGEYTPGEDPREVVKRESQEESGFPASGDFVPLIPQAHPRRNDSNRR